MTTDWTDTHPKDHIIRKINRYLSKVPSYDNSQISFYSTCQINYLAIKKQWSQGLLALLQLGEQLFPFERNRYFVSCAVPSHGTHTKLKPTCSFKKMIIARFIDEIK